jgi:hypothetical protein
MLIWHWPASTTLLFSCFLSALLVGAIVQQFNSIFCITKCIQKSRNLMDPEQGSYGVNRYYYTIKVNPDINFKHTEKVTSRLGLATAFECCPIHFVGCVHNELWACQCSPVYVRSAVGTRRRIAPKSFRTCAYITFLRLQKVTHMNKMTINLRNFVS